MPGWWVTRAHVADFMLDAAERRTYLKRSPILVDRPSLRAVLGVN